jgi:hypothetical protein
MLIKLNSTLASDTLSAVQNNDGTWTIYNDIGTLDKEIGTISHAAFAFLFIPANDKILQ